MIDQETYIINGVIPALIIIILLAAWIWLFPYTRYPRILSRYLTLKLWHFLRSFRWTPLKRVIVISGLLVYLLTFGMIGFGGYIDFIHGNKYVVLDDGSTKLWTPGEPER